jgi:hypothetical protein
MAGRSPIVALVLAISIAPAAIGQGTPSSFAPPIPSGPPLVVPAVEPSGQTWIENGSPVVPAGARISGLHGQVTEDAVWPGPSGPFGSACHFDTDDGSNGIFPDPTSYQILVGSYFSTRRLGPPIPAFNYVPVSFRHVWDLGQPWGGQSPVPGHWEFLADVTGAAITSSYGNWFAGGSFLFRYNWADRGALLVPYTQGGVGGVFNDAYKDPFQRAIGQSFEFRLHAEVGLKCFVAPNLSLDVEGGLQHISNANFANRNLGVNALGGSVGLTYYFGGAGN